MTVKRRRPGAFSWISTAPAIIILPSCERPGLGLIGSFLVRKGMLVSSTSTKPASVTRSGSTMARRSLCSSSQAVLYEPSPSCSQSCRAEIPFLWVATSHAAMNQIRNGKWVLCSAVPAVTEVCLRQRVH